MNETNGTPSIREMIARSRAQQPTLGGELRAMAREAVKDIRSTLHMAYFGTPEHQSEPGTPLNPTNIQVTAQLEPGRAMSRGR